MILQNEPKMSKEWQSLRLTWIKHLHEWSTEWWHILYMYCTVDTFKKSTIKEFYDLGGITITGIVECRTT